MKKIIVLAVLTFVLVGCGEPKVEPQKPDKPFCTSGHGRRT
jgi:uncharacterized protein YcfL